MNIKEWAGKISLVLAYTTVLVLLLAIVYNLSGQNIASNKFFYDAILFLPIVVIIFHAVSVLGSMRAGLFLLTGTSFGLFIEVLGLNYAAFGDFYIYQTDIFSLYGVPFVVPLYWFFFLYVTYSVTNTRIILSGVNLPGKIQDLIPVVFWDIITILAIDIAMDPLHIYAGNWKWFKSGIYFGVPISNFMGWAIWSGLFLFTIRVLDIKYPILHPRNLSLLVLPLYIYATLASLFLLFAIQNGIAQTVILGFTLMLSVIVKPLRQLFTS